MEFAAEPLSEDALLLRFGDAVDLATNARVQEAARALRNARIPGVSDIAPAYASLLVRFDPLAWGNNPKGAHARLLEAVHAAVAQTQVADPATVPGTAKVVEIPVCYGGGQGPDLEAVAVHAQVTPEAVIARHCTGKYTVAMLGFAPGFPYLLGLDPALHMPRRANPRTRVPAGSVAIGGAQTGIYPRELPGGWNLIGRTPLRLFDPGRHPPCLLAPGDEVRFRAIDADRFDLDPRDQG